VHEIGARWGLTGATEFSRAFRSMYGMPPAQYRASRRIDRDRSRSGLSTPTDSDDLASS
jgi:AraC-like DNA-binding protein